MRRVTLPGLTAAQQYKVAIDRGLSPECRLAAYMDALALRHLLDEPERQLLALAGEELAALVAARGEVRSAGLAWTVEGAGKLRCALPVDDPYISKG